MQEELAAQVEAIKDELKATMTEENTDTLTGADFKVTWKAVESTRLDTAALKKELPNIYAVFAKTTSTKRFTVA